MVAQSSALEMLPSKDRHAARGQRTGQLLARVLCGRQVPWQALLEV